MLLVPLQLGQVRHLLLQQPLGMRQVGAAQRLLPHAVQQRVPLVAGQLPARRCQQLLVLLQRAGACLSTEKAAIGASERSLFKVRISC